MSMKVLQAFLAVVLLSLPISGEEEIMVCKNIQEVFSDAEDEPEPGTSLARLRGPPGPQGEQGFPGLNGLPGAQGIPGDSATVDYDRISDMIEREVDQNPYLRCFEESGLIYNGKCYILPYITIAHDLTYDQAVHKCRSYGALIAEIHSMAQQETLQDFFRAKIPASRDHINVVLAMNYQSLTNTLRFRSGAVVPVSKFKWHSGYPGGSGIRVGVQISNPTRDLRWFFNGIANREFHAVICERSL